MKTKSNYSTQLFSCLKARTGGEECPRQRHAFSPSERPTLGNFVTGFEFLQLI